jgi:hypothetical protein
MPTAPVEKLFMQSFSRSVQQYQEKLQNVNDGRLALENVNYDTGEVSTPGAYQLEDDAYAYWLNKLAQKGLQTVKAEIKANLLQHYHDSKAPLFATKDRRERTRLLAEIEQLKSQPVISGSTDN